MRFTILSTKVLGLASLVAKTSSFGAMVTIFPVGAAAVVVILVGVIKGLGLGSKLFSTEVLVLASSFGDISVLPMAGAVVATLVGAREGSIDRDASIVDEALESVAVGDPESVAVVCMHADLVMTRLV